MWVLQTVDSYSRCAYRQLSQAHIKQLLQGAWSEMTVETREMTKSLESNQPVLFLLAHTGPGTEYSMGAGGWRAWQGAYLEFTGNFWCQLQ